MSNKAGTEQISNNTGYNNSNLYKNVTNIFFNNIVWFLLIFSVIVMGLINPVFFKFETLRNIIIQGSVLGVLTVGMAFTILIGEIDLSIIGTLGFSAGVGTMLMVNGLPWFLAILIIVAIGLLIGLFNGLLIAKVRAVSLIETLAMGLTLQGALLALTQGRSVIGFSDAYKWAGQGSLFNIPGIALILIIVYIIVYIVWKKTIFGRSLFALGGNKAAAHASGIQVDRAKILVFVISGGTAGFAGFLLSSYMGAVTSYFGGNMLLYSIAAAVIGGVSLTGGRGQIINVLGGVMIITVIQIGLQLLGISSYYVTMAGGMMILVAVVVDALRLRVQG